VSATELSDLATQWRRALESWAIPAEIIDRASESPWVHPPKLFRMSDDDQDMPDTASFRVARAVLAELPEAGTVLDVGCGGGRSSLPLGSLLGHATGVDESIAMLLQFVGAAAARGVPCTTVVGTWPAVADHVDVADLVVCHHVAYNVADIVPFVEALTAHARRHVVVELTGRHPQSPLNPLWQRFWGLERPSEPSYELFAAIVRAMGHDPAVEVGVRPPRRAVFDRAELVAFVRRRLCLTADRDPEVDDALGEQPQLAMEQFATVSWAARSAL
jgi:SAM-dependent methyltransferase